LIHCDACYPLLDQLGSNHMNKGTLRGRQTIALRPICKEGFALSLFKIVQRIVFMGDLDVQAGCFGRLHSHYASTQSTSDTVTVQRQSFCLIGVHVISWEIDAVGRQHQFIHVLYTHSLPLVARWPQKTISESIRLLTLGFPISLYYILPTTKPPTSSFTI
jgi:hypothetical protein